MAEVLGDAFARLLGRDTGLVLCRGEPLANFDDRCGHVVHDAQQRVLTGAELFQLYPQGPPAGDEVRERTIAETPRFGHHAPALFFRGVEQLDGVRVGDVGHRVGLGLGPAQVLGGVPLGCGADLERLGLGSRCLFVKDPPGFCYQLGGPLLGLGDDVAGRVMRGPEDLGRLRANCPRQCRLVQDRLLSSVLGLGDALAQDRLALERGP